MSAMATKSCVLSIVYCKVALIHLTIEGLGVNPNLFVALRIFEREIGLAFICGTLSNINVSLKVSQHSIFGIKRSNLFKE
jgi:hypothetical protein